MINVAIAEAHGVVREGLRPISTHRTNVLEKMGFANDAALVRYAMRHGLVEEDGFDAL